MAKWDTDSLKCVNSCDPMTEHVNITTNACDKNTALNNCPDLKDPNKIYTNAQFTQTWDTGTKAYAPDDLSVKKTYDPTGKKDCAYQCNTDAHYNPATVTCELDKLLKQTCANLPTQATWQVGTYTSTWDSKTGKYSAPPLPQDALTGDCAFQCNENYTYDPGKKQCVIDGACGTADKTNFAATDTAWGSATLCAAGSTKNDNVNFPIAGGPSNWTCYGDNGGADAHCSANRDKAAVSTYHLYVGKSGGNGNVKTADKTIICGSFCNADFSSGTAITLTATPNAGSVFSSWSGCDTPSGNNCTVTMGAARKTVTANFTATTANITATYSAGGSISPSGTLTVNQGSPKPFIITPNSGYSVAAGSISGTCPTGTFTKNLDGTATYATGLITGNCSMYVTFTDTRKIGLCSTSAVGVCSYPPNTSATATANSTQDGWTWSCQGDAGTQPKTCSSPCPSGQHINGSTCMSNQSSLSCANAGLNTYANSSWSGTYSVQWNGSTNSWITNTNHCSFSCNTNYYGNTCASYCDPDTSTLSGNTCAEDRIDTPTCTSFSYSGWGTCDDTGHQTRSVLSSSPSGCIDGSPDTSSTCTYTPPTCNSWTYTNWSDCDTTGHHSRSVISSSPSGCIDGSPDTYGTCTYTPPTCASFSYSGWGACGDTGHQTRSVLSSSPSGCTGGSPDTSSTCTYTPPTCTSFTYSGWGACDDTGHRTRGVFLSFPPGCTGGSPDLYDNTCTPDSCRTNLGWTWTGSACTCASGHMNGVTGACNP